MIEFQIKFQFNDQYIRFIIIDKMLTYLKKSKIEFIHKIMKLLYKTFAET